MLLLLLFSGIQPNPGPVIASCNTPTEFKDRSGLGIIHLHICSLLPKIDMLHIWAKSTNADVIVLSEMWLSKSCSDEAISIKGYNVFRTDRPKKGGGVAIYCKSKFSVNILLSKSISKQFEFLANNLESTRFSMTVVGCYRPPSAVAEALTSLTKLLADLNDNEMILTGDLNLDWLKSTSDG